MTLKSIYAEFTACVVQTKAGTASNIPAGRHTVIENQSFGGGVTIATAGIQIDIHSVEWQRLIAEGLVKDV